MIKFRTLVMLATATGISQLANADSFAPFDARIKDGFYKVVVTTPKKNSSEFLGLDESLPLVAISGSKIATFYMGCDYPAQNSIGQVFFTEPQTPFRLFRDGSFKAGAEEEDALVETPSGVYVSKGPHALPDCQVDFDGYEYVNDYSVIAHVTRTYDFQHTAHPKVSKTQEEGVFKFIKISQTEFVKMLISDQKLNFKSMIDEYDFEFQAEKKGASASHPDERIAAFCDTWFGGVDGCRNFSR